MTRRWHWLDPTAALCVVALSLAANWPLVGDGLPRTNDTPFHMQRVIALAELMRQGEVVGRWLPDVAFGYGIPIFGYYAPLSYALPLLFVWLTDSPSFALRFAIASTPVVSALGMFFATRRMFGLVPAIAAAVVFAWAPYQLFNMYARGAYAESCGLALMPWALWLALRLRDQVSPGRVVALAAVLAATVLTHNLAAAMLLPVLGGVALIPASGSLHPRRVGGMAAALGLGLLYSVGFWLPALAEATLVPYHLLIIDPLTFAEWSTREAPWFSTSLLYDYAQHPTPGLAQVTIAVVALVAGWRLGGERRWLTAWAMLVFALSWAFQTQLASLVYDVLKPVQFPFRLLTLTALSGGVLAASIVATMPGSAARAVACAAIVLLAGLNALPTPNPERTFPSDEHLTADSILRAELVSEGVGTTVYGEYLPRVMQGVESGVDLRRLLLGPDRSASRGVPSTLVLDGLTWSPTSLRARVKAAAPERLSLHQFAHAGWSARLDGVPAPVQTVGQLGVVGVDVPAGEHELLVEFGQTPVRMLGAGLSALAILSTALFIGWGSRRAIAMIGTTVMIAAVACGRPVEAHRSYEGAWRPISRDVVIAGVGIDSSRVAAGMPLVVRLDLLSLADRDRPLDAMIILRTDDGREHAARWSHGPLSRWWSRGELVRTHTDLRLPAEMLGRPGRVSALFDDVEVELGRTSTAASARGSSDPGGVAIGEGVRLLGAVVSGADSGVVPGARVDVVATIAADGPTTVQHLASLSLRGQREVARSEARALGEWFNPQPGWQAGDRFRQQLRLMIPESTQPGSYRLALNVEGRARSWIVPFGGGSVPRSRPPVEVTLGTVEVRR